MSNAVIVTTNYPASNIAKGVFEVPPVNGHEARALMAAALLEQGFVIEGSLGKPIRRGVYMVAITPKKD